MRERDGERVPRIVFTKGGGAWLEDIAGDRRRRRRARLDASTSALRARASATASRCRAISIRRVCSARRSAYALKSQAVLDAFGHGAGSRLQSRPRHLAAHRSGARRRARRCRSRAQPRLSLKLARQRRALRARKSYAQQALSSACAARRPRALCGAAAVSCCIINGFSASLRRRPRAPLGARRASQLRAASHQHSYPQRAVHRFRFLQSRKAVCARFSRMHASSRG